MTQALAQTTGTPVFDANAARQDFPALHQEVHGRPLVYLDNAATTLKPQAVIDAVVSTYAVDCANIHRGVHLLSQRATDRYENARKAVARFIGAGDEGHIVFVRGTTEAINLVASSFGPLRAGPGKNIVISGLEHHSNIVPWQLLCERTGAELRVVELDDAGQPPLEGFEALIDADTAIVATAHVSNALGTVQDVARIVELAHAHGVPVLLDGAQAASHLKVDVAALGVDFYAVSGHKLFGPTGVGALYARTEHLDAMPPYQGGGDMIRTVTFEKSTWAGLPAKFEAGTPNIAGGIGLGAAIEYLEALDWEAMVAYETELLAYGTEQLAAIDGLTLVGTAEHKASVLSFVLDGVHPHDIGTIVDMEGVAIRTGHHCAQPVMDRFGVPATSRASLSFYNTRADIDALIGAIHKVKELFG